ncbi:Protein kinase domain-containing protein [Streptomyces sp. 1222.5]|uniref:protein kinase family protein n=1 Tax=unclassified Streptomyces TaxID=2593676 RepID=UPI00089D0CE0|nr:MULTISPECIES: protein kinase family protein [unclassified Streptomyces]PKW07434.1 protein kinase-like protein [Streptomyces sp. 5112.2]SEC88990.1 Protein kinase domain-containing protein [Streptomyces sp. 1222.5]
MADPTELMLADLSNAYADAKVSNTFLRLYVSDSRFDRAFASLHERLNGHFASINDRAETTHHYWAEQSREMLALVKEVANFLNSLKHAGIQVDLAASYAGAIKSCQSWLVGSGGSTIPDDFEQITLIQYEPVFSRSDTEIKLKKSSQRTQLQLIGEGSYAKVFSFVDPDYGIKFAVKRANKNLSARDLHRFQQEFAILKRLRFPYIIEVFQYDAIRNEYQMEFCESTLRKYIKKFNSTLSFSLRKRIALQFLYGVNYIHTEGLLHRDVSLQNVLIKTFNGGAVLVKLSDFGLAKDKNSEYTRTKTEMRGTYRDPVLESFKDYGVRNEIYSIGWVLSYIFSGREALLSRDDAPSKVVRKCTAHDVAHRYGSVRELIGDVEGMEATPPPADAPA